MLWDLWTSNVSDFPWQLLMLQCTALCQLAHTGVQQCIVGTLLPMGRFEGGQLSPADIVFLSCCAMSDG